MIIHEGEVFDDPDVSMMRDVWHSCFCRFSLTVFSFFFLLKVPELVEPRGNLFELEFDLEEFERRVGHRTVIGDDGYPRDENGLDVLLPDFVFFVPHQDQEHDVAVAEAHYNMAEARCMSPPLVPRLTQHRVVADDGYPREVGSVIRHMN